MLDIIRMALLRFRRDDEGAAMVEYGLLVALIAVVVAVAAQALGLQISTLFASISTALVAYAP